jgi:hypothetical protein
MKKVIAVIALLLVLIASTAMAAGTVTVTTQTGSGDAIIVHFAWTADAADGSVPATLSGEGEDWPINYSGCIYAMETNPGSTAPTADYDITLTDSDGVDMLGGGGADRSATVSEIVPAKIGTVFGCFPTQNEFTLTITNNSVNSATGTVKVYIYQDGQN